MAVIYIRCRSCERLFPSFRTRVPGVRKDTTRWGPGRLFCGLCQPIAPESDFEAGIVARRPTSEVHDD